MPTKAEKREKIRNNLRKMGVDNRTSVRLVLRIKQKKAAKIINTIDS